MRGLPGSGQPGTRFHGTIDSLGIRIGSLVLPPIFRDGVESVPFEDHLDGVALSLPRLTGEASHAVTADTLEGPLDAGVRLATEVRASRPTVIYHHGIGELPFDTSFRRIFRPRRRAVDANLVVVRAPFHEARRSFVAGSATLSGIIAMQAVSVALTEALCERFGRELGTPVIVAGTSLGGFVTNLHHIHHGGAHRYVPLLAGLAEDDVFLGSVYRHGVAKRARANPERIEALLNFEGAFAATDPAGVHPLLARHDRIVRYPVQAASYNGRPIATIETGHLTAAVAAGALREHVRQSIDRERDA